MKYNWPVIVFLSIFFVGVGSARAVDKASTATTKKERTPVKKKRVIKNKPASKKSVPLGSVKTAASQKQESKNTPSWIQELKRRLARSQARQNQIVAVAAVRGSEAQDAPPLYWKGKTKAGDVTIPEASEFDAALESALKGESDESITQLQAFLTKYPESPLAGDAKDAITKLQEPIDQPVQP